MWLAVYWLARMLDGGADPAYLARRLARMAIEDIGLADPRAQQMAVDAWDLYDRLGSPEGELTLAQAVIYLACAPKSCAVYDAYNQARSDISKLPSYEVPLHLRNAPTKLMKELGYGDDYKYAHDFDNNFIEQEFLPDEIKNTAIYEPQNNSRENQTKDFLKNRWKGKYGY